MNFAYTITVISGFASLLPAAAGWLRIRRIQPDFYPFIILLSADFMAELVSFFAIHFTGTNTGWYNVYALAGPLLLVWQLYTWSPTRHYTLLLKAILSLLLLLWLGSLYFTGIRHPFKQFYLVKDTCIAAACFYLLYYRIPSLSFGLLKNAVVLICSGWLIVHVFNAITEVFISFSQWLQTPALALLRPVFSVVNFIVIIIHLIAVIWIPPRTPSSLQQL